MALEKKEARAEKEEAEKYQKIQQEMVSYVYNCLTGKIYVCVLVNLRKKVPEMFKC